MKREDATSPDAGSALTSRVTWRARKGFLFTEEDDQTRTQWVKLAREEGLETSNPNIHVQLAQVVSQVGFRVWTVF